MSDSKKFLSRLIDLSMLFDRSFIIPTYQRPYVWGILEIEKLLDDAKEAFLADPDAPYFIGTVLTEKRVKRFEIIDGQQRFTTLWMVAAVFNQQHIKSELINFLLHEKDLRIDFEIRNEIRAYFQQLSHPEKGLRKYTEEEIETYPYLKNIAAGLATINFRIKECSARGIDMVAFGNFLYHKLIMVENLAPERVDLNKLFATINSTGIQLEQSDILKSKLLNKTSNKLLFSKIWEACENMEDYFERNVRKTFSKTAWSTVESSQFARFEPSLFLFKESEIATSNHSKVTIAKIFATADSDENDEDQQVDSNQGGHCRSIISFPQLLIHTYRIHRYENQLGDFPQLFHSAKLLEIFDGIFTASQEEIDGFFYLLWQIRFTLDKFIIKWTSDADSKDEFLELSKVSKNMEKNYFTRVILEKSASQMLQSVLYFTGDYLRQYWLTPTLLHLSQFNQKEVEPSSAEVLQLLETIDNANSQSNLTDKSTSFQMLRNIQTTSFSFAQYLHLPLGTSFYRYWFQKLEYILWKNWQQRDTPKFRSFRITSKNSIEHIFPQNPDGLDLMSNESLHSFGNLVLLTVNQNSEYGRKRVEVKHAEFNGKNHYDSLKSQQIFNMIANGENWDENAIAEHRKQMTNLFIDHYDAFHLPQVETPSSLATIDDDEHNE